MIRTLVALAAFCAGRPAQAQYVPPQVSPYGTGGISPYLNLLRPGNPAVNFYGLVAPQIQQQAQIGLLQQQTQQLAQRQSVVAPPTNQAQVTTGHQTRFMQYNQYFNSTGTIRAPNFGRR
jgi:hypothetical protein